MEKIILERTTSEGLGENEKAAIKSFDGKNQVLLYL